jgi:hypothetical protein
MAAKKKAEEQLAGIIKPSVGDNTIAFNARNDLEALLISYFESKYSLYAILNLGLCSPDGISQISFDITDSSEVLFHKYVFFWLSKHDFVPETLLASPTTISEGHPDSDISDSYKQLSDKLYTITQFEQEVEKDHNAEAQKHIESRLGKPKFYTKREKTNHQALELSIGNSWIGNLVDESHTLNLKDLGMPMKNFHEFFCSTLTTLCFDGEVFFTTLKQLKILNSEIDSFNPIYQNLLDLLHESYSLGIQFYSEIAVDEKSSQVLSTLKSNLDRLNLELTNNVSDAPQNQKSF